MNETLKTIRALYVTLLSVCLVSTMLLASLRSSQSSLDATEVLASVSRKVARLLVKSLVRLAGHDCEGGAAEFAPVTDPSEPRDAELLRRNWTPGLLAQKPAL